MTITDNAKAGIVGVAVVAAMIAGVTAGEANPLVAPMAFGINHPRAEQDLKDARWQSRFLSAANECGDAVTDAARSGKPLSVQQLNLNWHLCMNRRLDIPSAPKAAK